MAHITHSTYNASKIDARTTDGLAGTNNSLAYRIHEIEKHFHNNNKIYGNDGANNLQENVLASFRITAGTGEAFGTELQIHDGTVIESGDSTKKFDIGRIFVEASSAVNQNYIVEIYRGTGTFATSVQLTSFLYRPATAQNDHISFTIPCSRVTCNSKIWIRCKCGTNGATIDLMFEVHTYVG